MAGEVLGLASFFRIQLGPPLVCELPLTQTSVELASSRLLPFLHGLQGPQTAAGVQEKAVRMLGSSEADAAALVARWLRSGLLERKTGSRHEDFERWTSLGGAEALALHWGARPHAVGRHATHLSAASAAAPLPTAPVPNGSWAEWARARKPNWPFLRGAAKLPELGCILKGLVRPGVRTHLIAHDVEGLAPGIYRYDAQLHGLSLQRAGLFREEAGRACNGDPRVRRGACSLVLSALWDEPSLPTTGPRAFQARLTEVAEVAETYSLLATAFGFATHETLRVHEELLGEDLFESFPACVLALG